MISYKIVAMADKISSEETQYQYYPRICKRKKINLHQLSKLIAQQSTASEADVNLILWAFINNISSLLLDNYSVDLNNFGIFSLHAKVKGSPTEKEVKAKNITGLKIAFRPSKVLKDELRSAQYKKVK